MSAPETTARNHDARALLAKAECIRVELSERDRDRVPMATCSLAEVTSTTSSPICKLARELLHLGVDARTPMSIWRGRTKCFDDVPVGRWAELTVKEGQSGPVFAPYVPFSGIPVMPQSAKSDG